MVRDFMPKSYSNNKYLLKSIESLEIEIKGNPIKR